MSRRFLTIFLTTLFVLLIILNSYFAVLAESYQTDPTAKIPAYVDANGSQIPDWSKITLADIPALTQGGRFDLSTISQETGYSSDELISILGYDPSRSWDAGTHLEDILMLGDLKDVSNMEEWSLGAVATATGGELEGLNLSDFGLLKNQTAEDLIYAVPNLESLGLEEVEPLFDLAKTGLGISKAIEMKDVPLGELANSNFDFANLKMDNLDLSQYDLKSIEGIENAQFKDFASSDGAMTSEIPYMEYVQMASYIFELANFNFLGKIDVVYGDKEARRVNTVSGSYQEGFNVPCALDSCAHIELTDAMDVGLDLAPLHGKQWIAGKSQIVEGGFGPLKYANPTPEPGKEPTGRNPFGEFFKVVLTDTIESEGKAEFGLYFRYCMYIFGYRTCTPYFIGPAPWIPQKEKDIVILGLGGTAKGHVPSSPGAVVNPSQGSNNSPQTNAPTNVDRNEEDCTTYKSVNMGALKKAISNIESRGSGDYTAVGDWVEADSGQNRGRALGKYQYMSYRSEVIAEFSKKEGGLELLKRIEENSISPEELKSKLPTYFNESVQEQIRQKDFRNLLNSAYNLGDRDSKLVYRLGGWHYAGTGKFDEDYAQRAEEEYNKELGKSQQKCQQHKQQQKCKGNLIKPASSGVKTSGFGMRVNPVTGRRKNHNGVDLGASIGTSILAADSGEVVFVQTGCQVGDKLCGGRFGNYIKIRHCNGWVTTYAHLSSVNVSPSQKVTQGQTIGGMGTTGSSTGSHLHFELNVDGATVDPEKYLPPL